MSLALTFGLGSAPLTPPPSAGTDLLSSVVQYLLSATTVTALLGTATNVFHEVGKWQGTLPFILVQNYTESLPAETAEDQVVYLRICCYADDEADARQLGTAVKQAVDSPNENSSSLRTGQFTFTGGSTTGTMRNPSKPRKVKGISAGNVYSWVEEIDYEFWVTPMQ